MKSQAAKKDKITHSQIRDLRKLRHMAMGHIQHLDNRCREILRQEEQKNIAEEENYKPHPVVQVFAKFSQLVIRLINTERKIVGEGPIDISWLDDEVKELLATG